MQPQRGRSCFLRGILPVDGCLTDMRCLPPGSFTCFLTGLTYTFGVWSPVVKKAYSYSQAWRNCAR